MVVTRNGGSSSTAAARSVSGKSNGKAAFEVVAVVAISGTSVVCAAGIAETAHTMELRAGEVLDSTAYGYSYYEQNGNLLNNAVSTAFGAPWNVNGTVLYFECDFDAGTVEVFKDNVSQGTWAIQTGETYHAHMTVFRGISSPHQLRFRSDPATFTSTQSAGYTGVGWSI
jgi:hypothetical protein